MTEPVSRLIQRQAIGQLHGYRGNLHSVLNAVRNGWLPGADEPEIGQHLDALRQYLAAQDQLEVDGFLLRYALTVPGTQRGIVPPLMVLEPNRGGFRERRQREAAGQIERLCEALAIGRQVFPDLSLETESAISELASLLEGYQVPTDEDWLGWYGELSVIDAAQLAERAVELVRSSENCVREIGLQILERLVGFREPPLNEASCEALLALNVLWPPTIFRDSGDRVAHELVARIESTLELGALNHLLFALAWTRSTVALHAFRRWSQSSPSWASALSLPPEQYVHDAGWCVGEGDQRRELISPVCVRLVLAEETQEQTSQTRVVCCRTKLRDKCPACQGQLCWLLDFSQVEAKYFSGEFADAPRKVLCCLRCACFEPIFSRYNANGESEWLSPHAASEMPNSDERPATRRILNGSLSPTFITATPFSLSDASTLGGAPMWLQDAEYPICLECGRVMAFLAQHDNGALGEEGIYYAFFCSRCQIAAASYQQT